jgi:hypothetical protein
VCKETDKVCWNRCTRKESYISGNSFENQLDILKEGAENILEWSGAYPVAFRGGSFDADATTLKVLQSLNIHIDSSLSSPDHDLARELPVNMVSEYGSLVEVPLYNYVDLGIGSFRRYRIFDIESATLLELKYLVDAAIQDHLGTIVLLMHSTSFCRPEFSCPIQQNLDRFDDFLSYVGSVPEVEVITINDFWQQYMLNREAFVGSGIVPETGYFLTLYRSIVRFNQGINNRVFVGINVVIFILLFLFGAYILKRYLLKDSS